MNAHVIIFFATVTPAFPFSVAVEDPPFEMTAGVFYSGTDGNTNTHNLGFDGSAVNRFSRVQVDCGGNYLTARSEGEKNAESIGATAGLKIFVKRNRLYALYRTKWERNTFAGLEHRLSNVLGFGVVIAKSNALNLNVEAGVNYIYESYTIPLGTRPDDRVVPRSDKLPSFHVGVEYLVGVREVAEVKANIGYDMSFQETADQLFGATGVMSVFFTDWLAITVAESVAWDKTPQEGYEKYDLTSKLGITLRYREGR